MSDTALRCKTETLEEPATAVSMADRISVIMANLNGERHIGRAILSVLEQTHRDLELIVCDDGSTDESRSIIRNAMARDPRVRLIECATPQGPASARNRALQAASGDWIAIVDSDDLIHPDRLKRLLWSALTLKSDLVADDVVYFGANPMERQKTLLEDLHLDGPQKVDAVALISGRLPGRGRASLGYLKPLIRRSALAGLRYDEALRIDEDHDLYLRLLLTGATLTLIPDAMYLYRRHPGSISYRFSTANLSLMVSAQESLLRQIPRDRKLLLGTAARRLQRTRTQLRYVSAVEALKAGRPWEAAARTSRHPGTWPLFLQSLKEHAQRRWRSGRAAKSRTRVRVVLCQAGQVVPPEYSDARLFTVPAVVESGWSPSSAYSWASLVHLSCTHDLDIIALNRAGEYALGLVPRYVSARVVHTETAPARAQVAARPPIGFIAEGV